MKNADDAVGMTKKSRRADRGPTPRQLHDALVKVKLFHEAGRISIRQHSAGRTGRMAYGEAESVDAKGLTGETLRKARVFANGKVGYTKDELSDLVDARVAHSDT